MESAVASLLVLLVSTSATPPTFVHEPNKLEVFFSYSKGGFHNADNGPLTLTCRAHGNPEPLYRWTKNGLPFNTAESQLVQTAGEGTITFPRPKPTDAGLYQCFASNIHGTAVDRPVTVSLAFSDSFVPSTVLPRTYLVAENMPFIASCTAPDSYPKPRVSWILKSDGFPIRFEAINRTHISMSENGTLYFSHVSADDEHQDLFYTCATENTILKEYKFGPRFRLNVTRGSRTNLTVPTMKLYANSGAHTVALGEKLKLFCIFSYGAQSQSTPTWTKDGAPLTNLMLARINWGTNHGKSLEIDNVTLDDAGQYSFRLADGQGCDYTVTVEVPPFWVLPPVRANVGRGSTVLFDCNAGGTPEPTFTFFKNGEPLVTDSRIVQNRNQLILSNVSMGDSGAGDTAIYQCRAENVHGHVWTNFFLNVFG